MGYLALRAGNSFTQILQADPTILRVLDIELRYPTEFAVPPDAGWRPPPGEGGGWDGWMRLLRRPRTAPAYFPSGLLARVCRVANKMGYQVHLDDQRERPPEGMPEFPALSLRDYQREAVEAAIKIGRGVLDLPPRAGKTRMAAELQRRLGLKTLWLAPTDRIVQQTVDVLEGFFGKHYAARPDSAATAHTLAGMQVVVMTAAMAARLPPEWYRSREVVIVDEWHHAAAKSYGRDIFPKLDHVFYRYGMTGTHYRSGDDAMAMHAVLSETIYRLSPRELLTRGHLVPTHTVFVPVNAPRLRGVGRTFHGGFGAAGIHDHEKRNELAAAAAVSLFRLGRRVLILVGTKSQGRALQQRLSVCLPQAPPGAEYAAVEFLSTDRGRPTQQKVIDSFLSHQEVKVLIGTSLLGEGVDLPNADALVYAKGEKAEVSLTQAVYRVGTAIEGKRAAIVVDFADRHHRHLREHSLERLRSYYREPTFTCTILDHPSQLEGWAAQVP